MKTICDYIHWVFNVYYLFVYLFIFIHLLFIYSFLYDLGRARQRILERARRPDGEEGKLISYSLDCM